LDSALRVLAAHGWFAQRSEATRARLAAIAKLRRYAKDELLYLAGDLPNGVYGLVSGALKFSFPRGDGEDWILHRGRAGFWVGDLALFSNAPRLVSAHATEPSWVVHLPIHDLMRLVNEDPRLYADFYALTYDNFRVALRIITNLSIASPDKRLADRLLLETGARADADGWISLSQTELSKLLAVSVPTLQRVMRRFVEAGLVVSKYARIRVVDHEGLRKLCADQSYRPRGRNP
jgi:CRP-like cAMP-binding protein